MADKKISALPAASTPLAGTEVLPIVQGGTTDQVSVANLTAGRAVSALSLATPDTDAATSITASGLSVGRGAAFAGGQTEIFTVGTRRLGIGTTGATSLHFYSGSAEAFRVDTNQNLVISTAGKGIDFSANAHAAGMTSELLDWYEEGTWTPVISADGAGVTTFTATSAVGTYTRIGRQITIICEYAYSDRGAVGGSFAVLTGLPFARAGDGLEPVVFTAINQAAFDTRTFQANFAATSGIYFQYNNGEGTLYSGAPYMTGNDFPAAGTVRFVMSYFA